jgi:hypothetical protein
MMDVHHKALYGISAAIAASVAGVVYFDPMAPKTWPTLSSPQATAIVENISKILGKEETVNLYCIDRDCNKITVALRKAGDAAKIMVKTDRPWQAEDGISVGAKTQETADALAKAVEKGSDGLLKPDAVDKQPSPYISFGHFTAE